MFESLGPTIALMRDEIPYPARTGRPDEFADLVDHVVANSMLNGEVIRLDAAKRPAPTPTFAPVRTPYPCPTPAAPTSEKGERCS